MNANISAFFICLEAIIYLLLRNLHDCTFKDFAKLTEKKPISVSLSAYGLQLLQITGSETDSEYFPSNFAKSKILKNVSTNI